MTAASTSSIFMTRPAGVASWVFGEVITFHGVTQARPVLRAQAQDRDPSICNRIDVVRAQRKTAVPVSGALGKISVSFEQPSDVGCQGGHNRILHRHFDALAETGPLTLEQRGEHCRSEMTARGEIDNRRSGLDRCSVGKPVVVTTPDIACTVTSIPRIPSAAG